MSASPWYRYLQPFATSLSLVPFLAISLCPENLLLPRFDGNGAHSPLELLPRLTSIFSPL